MVRLVARFGSKAKAIYNPPNSVSISQLPHLKNEVRVGGTSKHLALRTEIKGTDRD